LRVSNTAGDVLFEFHEEQVTKILRDEVISCAAHAERAPDFRDAFAFKNQDSARQEGGSN
jgi:hypothetical protein